MAASPALGTVTTNMAGVTRQEWTTSDGCFVLITQSVVPAGMDLPLWQDYSEQPARAESTARPSPRPWHLNHPPCLRARRPEGRGVGGRERTRRPGRVGRRELRREARRGS